MKIYIAGKITGNPKYKKQFEELKEEVEMSCKLTGEPCAVLNPATLPEGMSAADYMKICLAMIDVSDKVIFSKNAKESAGAMLELQYCKYIGKEYKILK